jgi:glycosyltransferase involved in cell wall biosynthesis
MSAVPGQGARRAPRVTVIALCYNHAAFLIECLNSIRAQTFRDFELIVTDDCSKDGSQDLIARWLHDNMPDAAFIRHQENRGLCRTLNEAIERSRGEFISMIATDDVWEVDKIERQVAFVDSQPADVAVVFSDASRIDVAGRRLDPDFIAFHAPGWVMRSGNIFPLLVERNFIPAMATLIRRSALEAVGGYDERLSFEDYDMWLRLASRFPFAFCDGLVACYRLVPTSIVHTVFHGRKPELSHTMFLIREKWIRSPLLSETQRTMWQGEFFGAAYGLYLHGDPRARVCLWKVFLRTRRPRALILAIACSIGVSRRVGRKIGGLIDGIFRRSVTADTLPK